MFADIDSIGNIRGIKAKQERLVELYEKYGDDLQEILAMAYDPYERYYSAYLAGKALRFNQLPHDSRMAEAVFKKSFKIGLSTKSINAIWPGLIPTHDVMLAKPVEWHRVKYPCWATLKLDGVRAIYRNECFYFRNGKEIRGLLHLHEALGSAPVLDGELLCPELNFQQSSGQIRSYAASPTAEFHIIDAPDHKSSSFADRMEDAMIYTSDSVKLINMVKCVSDAEVLTCHAAALAAGYEGTVIKPLDYTYVGKRSYDWMKIKQVESADVEVVDVFEGQGRLSGSLGGVVVLFNDIHVRVGSGFTDSLRDYYWSYPYKIIGSIIEVEYHEVTPDGSLRHPRFKRFRDDKA